VFTSAQTGDPPTPMIGFLQTTGGLPWAIQFDSAVNENSMRLGNRSWHRCLLRSCCWQAHRHPEPKFPSASILARRRNPGAIELCLEVLARATFGSRDTGIHPEDITNGMMGTTRGLRMPALDGWGLVTRDISIMRAIGKAIVEGLTTITTGTRIMTGTETGTATKAKTMTKTTINIKIKTSVKIRTSTTTTTTDRNS
jgi:hypothetical protein